MKKILIAGIIATIGMGILSKAAAANDCDMVIGTKMLDSYVSTYKNEEGGYIDYMNFLPVEAFSQALLNLKAYCCTQVVKKECTDKQIREKNTKECCLKTDKESFPEKYPESAYFFDQVLDVTMRRLDGYAPLAYGLAPDPTALERRKEITKIADTANGGTATEIEELYNKYRTDNRTKMNYNMETLLKKYNDNVESVSLLDKYTNLCTITRNLYDQMKKDDKISIGGYRNKDSFFKKCDNLVADRIKRENGYVKILMVEKTGKMIDEATKAYTKKHFVEEKLLELWDLIVKVKNMFQDMVKQAPVSQKCSK